MTDSAKAIDLTIITRPNCSLSAAGRLRFFFIMLLLSLGIAGGFALVGAWLIFPFAGLEILGLGWALYHISCHVGDYECIVVAGDQVTIETRNYKTVERVEFQRYWARIVVLPASNQGKCRVWIRSHGREVELGRFADDDGRLALSRQLKEYINNKPV